MANDFEIRDRAVRQLDALDVHLDDAAGEDVRDVGRGSLVVSVLDRRLPGPAPVQVRPRHADGQDQRQHDQRRSTGSRRCRTTSPSPTTR